MSDQQMNEISHKIYAAIMLRRFAAEKHSEIHEILAREAETTANRLMEV